MTHGYRSDEEAVKCINNLLAGYRIEVARLISIAERLSAAYLRFTAAGPFLPARRILARYIALRERSVAQRIDWWGMRIVDFELAIQELEE